VKGECAIMGGRRKSKLFNVLLCTLLAPGCIAQQALEGGGRVGADELAQEDGPARAYFLNFFKTKCTVIAKVAIMCSDPTSGVVQSGMASVAATTATPIFPAPFQTWCAPISFAHRRLALQCDERLCGRSRRTSSSETRFHLVATPVGTSSFCSLAPASRTPRSPRILAKPLH
jgi:hypothetical protein